jgi:hypothetical protein
MIKLKDLIIETWNSNIWPSDLWNSNIWNSDIWPSHVWEGENINEVADALNFWCLPSGKIEYVGDHIEWFLNNIDQDKFYGINRYGTPLWLDGFDEEGLPEEELCSEAEDRDVYNLAYSKGFVRLTKENNESSPLIFEYYPGKPPTQKQLKSIKDFTIEKGWKLQDGITNREVDLL